MCADATYKLIWQGYPVLVVGTTDKQCAFHPFGISLCMNEQTNDYEFMFKSIQLTVERLYNIFYCPVILVADASAAITNGFINVFNVIEKRIMCWFHVTKNMDSHLNTIKDKQNKAQLRLDIEFIQLLKNEEIFDAAIQLFIKKWKSKKCLFINNFVDYFINEWFKSNKGWFEGFAIGYPSSNNALEATNGKIKSLYTFRERLPVGEFLSVLEKDIIHQLSRERNVDDTITAQNAKSFAKTPLINLSLWTSTYNWIKEDRELIVMKNNKGEKIHFIESSSFNDNFEDFNKEFIKKILHNQQTVNWSDFDIMKNEQLSFWECDFINESENWINTKCSCPACLKNYICKHIVGLAARYKLCSIPLEAKNIPLGQKRKRGRVAKAKKALIVQ